MKIPDARARPIETTRFRGGTPRTPIILRHETKVSVRFFIRLMRLSGVTQRLCSKFAAGAC